MLALNTIIADGNGAAFFEPLNFNLPLINLISPLAQLSNHQAVSVLAGLPIQCQDPDLILPMPVAEANLLHHNKPFLIFDWKRNYRDLLAGPDKKTLVYTVGGAISPFAFNPLIPPKGVAAEIWLKKLIEIIAHAYYLGEGVMYLLQEAIHAVYEASGVYKGSDKSFPTFVDILHWLENHPVKGQKSLWMDSAMRGIKSICFGCMGKVVNTSMQSNLAALLKQNVILELDRLTNADKTLIVESMLLWIHHYRLGEPQRETFKHALIIEEAHHILAKKTQDREERPSRKLS